jgi:hypothetical protein
LWAPSDLVSPIIYYLHNLIKEIIIYIKPL